MPQPSLPFLDDPGATVVAVGAHADDIELGAGATLLRLRESHPGLRMVWVVLSADGPRAAEAESAAAAFGADAVHLGAFPDRFLPAHWEAVKLRLAEVAAGLGRTDLVLGPWRRDRHQDHRVVGDLLWQTWRSQPVLAYEIVKYESDLGHPNVLVTADERLVARKVELLRHHFPSQHAHHWFDETAFRGLMRLRGVQAGTTWAEGFHAEKLVW